MKYSVSSCATRPCFATRGQDDARAHKARVEQLRREMRDMKALQSRTKWDMAREQQRQEKADKEQCQREHMAAQAEFGRRVQEGIEDEKRSFVNEVLENSREYQEHKKALRQFQTEEDARRITDAYLDAKEWSSNAAELAREKAVDRLNWGIEDHLENYIVVRELNTASKEKEAAYQRERRYEKSVSSMDEELRLLVQNRNAALHELELVRAQAQQQLQPRGIRRASTDGARKSAW